MSYDISGGVYTKIVHTPDGWKLSAKMPERERGVEIIQIHIVHINFFHMYLISRQN